MVFDPTKKRTRRYSIGLDPRLWYALEYAAFKAEKPIRETIGMILERYLITADDDEIRKLTADAILWQQQTLGGEE